MGIVRPDHGPLGQPRPPVKPALGVGAAAVLAIVVLLAVSGTLAGTQARSGPANGVLTAPQRWSLDAVNRTG